jgi:hypothetical protein
MSPDSFVTYLPDRSELNERFDQLHFREMDRRDLVAAVLQRSDDSIQSKVLALVLITYRLRNNLFHGLKVITLLNHQKDNLAHATNVLQVLMPYSGRYIYLAAA